MRNIGLVGLLVLAVLAVGVTARAADDSKVKAATNQVEQGAKKIGDGKLGDGIEDTAKGVGKTVVEGSKYAGEKLRESGQAAEPQAKTAWDHFRESANAFGASVKHFVTRLFSD